MVKQIFEYTESKGCYVPSIYGSAVQAGFPSPADDFIEGKLDLNQYLIKHPTATFFVRVSGDSMIQAGIYEGDILVVDRSLEPRHGSVIIAVLDGQLTVKRLYHMNGKTMLVPENERYRVIEINEDQDFSIWGVVSHVIHKV